MLMLAHRVTVMLNGRCDQLFDLAADIERYPDYLPGWQSVRIVEQVGNQLRVEQQLGLPLFKHRFVSTARLERPARVIIQSSDGPFSRLHIAWHFDPVTENRCRVILSLDYELTNRALGMVADRLFRLMVDDVIARFVSRAQRLYGCRAIAE